MLSQLARTIKMALKSTEQERQLLCARSAVQRFPVVEWHQRTEDFHSRSINASRSFTGSKAWRKTEIYENMSRERNHYKTDKRKGTRPNEDIPISDADGVDDDDGTEDEMPTTATNISGVETLAGDAPDDDDSDDNGEYFPDSDSRSSSGVSDSDDLDSDENCGDYESYGLGDL